MAIHTLAQITSTAIICEKRVSPTSKTSFIAVWLAPPPIQLPATVVRPLQTASGPDPPTVSGLTVPTIISAKGPPTMMPKVPVKNMITALLPQAHDGAEVDRQRQ